MEYNWILRITNRCLMHFSSSTSLIVLCWGRERTWVLSKQWEHNYYPAAFTANTIYCSNEVIRVITSKTFLKHILDPAICNPSFLVPSFHWNWDLIIIYRGVGLLFSLGIYINIKLSTSILLQLMAFLSPSS